MERKGKIIFSFTLITNDGWLYLCFWCRCHLLSSKTSMLTATPTLKRATYTLCTFGICAWIFFYFVFQCSITFWANWFNYEALFMAAAAAHKTNKTAFFSFWFCSFFISVVLYKWMIFDAQHHRKRQRSAKDNRLRGFREKKLWS